MFKTNETFKYAHCCNLYMDPIIEKIKRDPKERDIICSSIETWRNHWFKCSHEESLKGIDGKVYQAHNWIYGREVRVFRMAEVDKKVVSFVAAGIQDLIGQIGLGFSVADYGVERNATEEVMQAIQPDGRVSATKLGQILIAERFRNPQYGGRPHADVIITDRYLVKETETDDWGQSQFRYGYIVLGLAGDRQKGLEFIRRLAKHESGHLFKGGHYQHHNEPPLTIPGYRDVSDCNMLWRASTEYTCERCADAITYFWRGLEAKTGEKFFKK